MRAVAVTLVVLATAVFAVPAASASQAELDRARSRANASAAALAAAETRLAVADRQLADVEARRRDDLQRLRALQAGLREVAVAEYIRGRQPVVPLPADPDDVAAQARAKVLADIVSNTTTDAIEQYRVAAQDLEATEARLASLRTSAATSLASYQKQAKDVDAQLRKLQALESDRIAREKAQRTAAAKAPARTTARVIGSGDWICPVQGPRAFSDDFGQPRNGGRKHQGNDILSPRGTPVVAPVAGVAQQHDNSLGGHAFYLHGADGVTYYGAHLDSYTSNYGSVPAGTVLGYVGNTGDARGGPTHLHFEIHPGGGGAVDPYPTLRAYC